MQTAPQTKTTKKKRPYALATRDGSRILTECAVFPTVAWCARMIFGAAEGAGLPLPIVLSLLACAAGYCLARFFRKDKDMANRLMNGQVVWLAGLILSLCNSGKAVRLFVSPMLCMGGLGFSVRQAARLRQEGRNLEAFAEAKPGPVILPVFTLPLCLLNGIWTGALSLAFVSAAFVFTFLFPLTVRHFRMLEKWREEPDNKALNEQLERVVFHPAMKPYFLRFLVMVLRPLYRHKVIGAENVRLDDDIPCIFVCNHGEVYGPIAAVLFVPFSFRPWVAYEITDKTTMTDRTLNGALKDFRLLPPKALRWIMEKCAAPLCASVMRQVNAIPVYHDNPRRLMQTFRETAYAMEAGDNILIFPENPVKEDAGKYRKEGVSEFFTGFTLIGQMYESRTGKSPQFIPMYANRKKRTISFGPAVRYDPVRPSNEEKERICDALRAEMQKMAGE